MNDWTGNSHSTFVTLGASNHTPEEREINDYYATDPKAIKLLLKLEEFDNNIWEPACGEGHLSKVLEDAGYNVLSTDLIDRGYGTGNIDFLNENIITSQGLFKGDIITNPPYKYAKQFVERALEVIPEGHKVAMFLRIQFLEGSARGELFDAYPPKIIYVARKRLDCAKNGNFDLHNKGAQAYCWFVWEKGWIGDPIIKWFNKGEQLDN